MVDGVGRLNKFRNENYSKKEKNVKVEPIPGTSNNLNDVTKRRYSFRVALYVLITNFGLLHIAQSKFTSMTRFWVYHHREI